MANEPPPTAPSGIEEAIGKVEDLYRAVTGNPPPSESYSAPIPVERDPTRFVEEQVDRLLSILSPPEQEPSSFAWSPPVSVWENEKEFVVSVDLAGVARNDVEVKMQDNRLTISGRRPAAFSNDHRLRASERPFGPFQRTVLLPPALRAREESVPIEARLRDGELEIRVTKEGTAAEGPKKIPVN
ncbi:MAG TPA: Hsp20/alpha crystallin family protein [Thermoanaerobaculia bacterium]|jgi:HSP20 family protein|nr:Hsp20/alpha crystallin family protein [Thermoanaerobaculia bacterium]